MCTLDPSQPRAPRPGLLSGAEPSVPASPPAAAGRARGNRLGVRAGTPGLERMTLDPGKRQLCGPVFPPRRGDAAGTGKTLGTHHSVLSPVLADWGPYHSDPGTSCLLSLRLGVRHGDPAIPVSCVPQAEGPDLVTRPLPVQRLKLAWVADWMVPRGRPGWGKHGAHPNHAVPSSMCIEAGRPRTLWEPGSQCWAPPPLNTSAPSPWTKQWTCLGSNRVQGTRQLQGSRCWTIAETRLTALPSHT